MDTNSFIREPPFIMLFEIKALIRDLTQEQDPRPAGR